MLNVRIGIYPGSKRPIGGTGQAGLGRGRECRGLLGVRAVPIAILLALPSACALGGEDTDMDLSGEHAELIDQAAAGNLGARQVLQGIEEFRLLFPDLLEDDTASPAERDAAIVDRLASMREAAQVASFTCDPYWRIIRHGETQIYLKIGFDGSARVSPLQPGEGGREKFMLCLDTDLTPGYPHHVIWANAGGYLRVNPELTWSVTLTGAYQGNPYAHWDEGMVGRWYFLKNMWAGYAQPTPSLGGKVFAHPDVDTLNGNALWDYLF
jgi:hypothetical protein